MKENRDTLKKVVMLLRPHWVLLLLSLIFALISVALTLYAPILTGRGVDMVVEAGRVDFVRLLPVLERLAVIVVLTAAAQWVMNLCNNRITYNVVKNVRTQAFSRLQELPLRYIDSHSHGDMISRVINDVDQLSDGLLMGFSKLFSGVATILGTLLFMFSINVKISLVVVCITPLSLFVASFIARRTFAMFRLQSQTRGELTGLIEEMVGQQKVVKAFSYEEEAKGRFREINRRLQDCSLKAIFFSSTTNPSTRFVNGLVYTGVGVIGALSAVSGAISVGQLSSFLTYANQYTRPFNEISGVVTELQNALASAARVFELMEEQPQEPDAPGALELTPDKVDGSVTLSQVAFSYRPGTTLIEDLNLAVEPGQRVAIVGPTGCGKTTIINLLMRFYDVDRGEIAVSGHPVRQITRSSLRAGYGMVLQETWLKSGTIAENIAYGRPGADREQIIAAAKEAHAHSFIKRMPQGYDTPVGESGGNLSQGQKQLLCIARVMLSLPSMLILDEATSSIDTRTEVRVQQAFARMMQGRTSFIVAHRLSTIKEADVILVMKDGHIIEQGKHGELLAKGGFYAGLYNSQFAAG